MLLTHLQAWQIIPDGPSTNTGEYCLPSQDEREGGKMTARAGKARMNLQRSKVQEAITIQKGYKCASHIFIT